MIDDEIKNIIEYWTDEESPNAKCATKYDCGDWIQPLSRPYTILLKVANGFIQFDKKGYPYVHSQFDIPSDSGLDRCILYKQTPPIDKNLICFEKE